MIAAVIGAALAVASVAVGRTPLGALNFGLLQWFGMRLCAGFDPGPVAEVVVAGDWLADLQPDPRRALAPPWSAGRWWSRYAPPRSVRVSWSLLRWVWPLTGWWSSYVRIGRRPRGARSWLSGEPGPIGREPP